MSLARVVMLSTEDDLDNVAISLSPPPLGSEAENGNFLVGPLSAENELAARDWARSLLLRAAQQVSTNSDS